MGHNSETINQKTQTSEEKSFAVLVKISVKNLANIVYVVVVARAQYMNSGIQIS